MLLHLFKITFILYLSMPLHLKANQLIEIEIFWSKKCPHCHQLISELEYIKSNHPYISTTFYQVDQNEHNREKLKSYTQKLSLPYGTIPATFIKNRGWIGYSREIIQEINEHILLCHHDPHTCQQNTESEFPSVKLPFIGTIDLTKNSFWTSTILIAFIDGFNPCSLWVLTLLMGIIIGTKSRSRIFTIGASFLITTAMVYGMFIAGIVEAINYLNHISWIQNLIACFALVFAIVNIKDYFWYKKGLSFTIPKKFQPKIYRGFKNLTRKDQSLLTLSIVSIVMALGIAIIELPCTAGFPVIWAKLVNLNQITGSEYILALLVYVGVYLLDELIIFIALIISLNASQLQEKQGRLLKLISGVIMLFIASSLIFAPRLMDNITSVFIMFGSAIAISFLVDKLARINSSNES